MRAPPFGQHDASVAEMEGASPEWGWLARCSLRASFKTLEHPRDGAAGTTGNMRLPLRAYRPEDDEVSD
jgi:hypothetical protein